MTTTIIRYRRRLSPTALGLALLLGGCSVEPTPDPETGRVPVELTATLPAGGSATRAVADGSAALDLTLIKVAPDDQGVLQYESLEATRAAGAGSQPVTIASALYYPAGGSVLGLAGCHPSPASRTENLLTWNVDGSQDVIVSAMQTGSGANPIENMEFKHILTQLRFYCQAESSAVAENWGAVTDIRLKSVPAGCECNCLTGEFSTLSGSEKTLSVPRQGATQLAGGQSLLFGDPVMFAPWSDSHVLSCTVSTTKGGSIDVAFPSTLFEAGKSMSCTLIFSEGTAMVLQPILWIDDWADSSISNSNGYPYVLPGNIIVANDGMGGVSGDFHTLWTSTPEHSERALEYNNSGFNTIAFRFQVATEATQSCKAPWRIPTAKELDVIKNAYPNVTLPANKKLGGATQLSTSWPYYSYDTATNTLGKGEGWQAECYVCVKDLDYGVL